MSDSWAEAAGTVGNSTQFGRTARWGSGGAEEHGAARDAKALGERYCALPRNVRFSAVPGSPDGAGSYKNTL